MDPRGRRGLDEVALAQVGAVRRRAEVHQLEPTPEGLDASGAEGPQGLVDVASPVGRDPDDRQPLGRSDVGRTEVPPHGKHPAGPQGQWASRGRRVSPDLGDRRLEVVRDPPPFAAQRG